MVSVGSFQEQFGRIKAVEEEKDQLIEDLIARIEQLESGGTGKQPQVEREQPRVSDAHIELRRINEQIDSNSFVSVLISGDCMLFLDNFVRSAQQGGEEAAHRLRTRIREHVLKVLEIPDQVPLRIRIYANTKKLASAYYNNETLDGIDDFGLFIRGFNMGDPMCDFVDAGNGEECTGLKLEAWLKHDMADVQCRALLFGGSANLDFARLLQPYIAENVQHSRITLIQGAPFAKDLELLKDNFPVVRITDVFRATRLASAQRDSLSAPIVDPPSYASSVASSANAAVNGTADVIQTSFPVPAPISGSRSSQVLLNSQGQRIDSIIKPLMNLVTAMKSKNYCSAYQIYGGCIYKKCSFVHGRRLERYGIEAQRWIARLEPCSLGFDCRDEKCLCGHACPETDCRLMDSRWLVRSCKFPPEMHNVDRT